MYVYVYTKRVFILLTSSTVLLVTAAGAAYCETHTNFADESLCLMTDNVKNEGKFLPLCTYVSLQVKRRFNRK
jgi:hypothetical protein